MIEGPGVWHGNELVERLDWQYEFSNRDIEEIKAAMGTSSSHETQTYCEFEDADQENAKSNFELPVLAKILAQVQSSLENGSGATLLSGIPRDEFSLGELRQMFWGILNHLGTPISQSAKGERLFDVRDAGLSDDDPRARGPVTKKRLSFHTDRCDVIGFMCIQAAKSGGENYVVSSPAIYNEIATNHSRMLDVLLDPMLYQRHNVDLGNESRYCRQPVFSFCEGQFACSFLRVLIDRAYASEETPDMTAEQKDAMDLLESLAEEERFHIRFSQKPGDILLLNNWITLHRRSEFEDFDEPKLKRHLIRAWLSMPNSRPIDPLFKDNFGATGAGEIRGGMRKAQEC